jgi:hypothetical protein
MIGLNRPDWLNGVRIAQRKIGLLCSVSDDSADETEGAGHFFHWIHEMRFGI